MVRADADTRMYCRRCDDVVSAIVPWRGWNRLLVAWWAGVVLVAVLFPMLAADYCVMLPSSFAYVFAGGTLYRLASERPICRNCSLLLEPGIAAGTGVHRKLAPPARS
jgi:hypothetical protein